MDSGDSEFRKKLLDTFKVEAQEHLQAISAGLASLEKAGGGSAAGEIVETLFREAHSLKGAARAVDLRAVETLCQSLEGVFAAYKRKEITATPGLFDLLYEAADALAQSLSAGEGEPPVSLRGGITGIIARLGKILRGEPPPAPPAGGGSETPAASAREAPPLSLGEKAARETVRVPAARLDAVLLEAEGLLAARLAGRQHAEALQDLENRLEIWGKEWRKIFPLMKTAQRSREGRNPEQASRENAGDSKLLDFLEWNGQFLKSLEADLAGLKKKNLQDQRSMEAMADHLLEDMKKVLMLPCATLLAGFPRFVRDLSRHQGKEVDLVIRGDEIEMDRRILEEMKDPLIHLVRNCIDHGIETPEKRRAKGKTSAGTITIALSQKNGGNVELRVEDDGTGIDCGKIRSAAAKAGIFPVRELETMSEAEVLPLIFRSGVSTSPMITDISGRGLGLAIVQEKVEKVGGTVSLENHSGAGTSFRLLLPITLATFRGVIVRQGEFLFAIPTAQVERVVQVHQGEAKTVENREVLEFSGELVPLASFEELLPLGNQSPGEETAESRPVVVLARGKKRLAIRVDEVVNEQEVLVKNLGSQLRRVRNISGATVLGDGRVVPILHVGDLMTTAVRASEAGTLARAKTDAGQGPRKKSVLVAEDSITSRMLLKNILEAAGYEVNTAVDGMEAITRLRSGSYDLIVSDVDMPRLNGFDLTSRVRSDKKLADLPVVLVTALSSREDQEKGIEVGANAYIVKSSFDQSNLLEVIKRLV